MNPTHRVSRAEDPSSPGGSAEEKQQQIAMPRERLCMDGGENKFLFWEEKKVLPPLLSLFFFFVFFAAEGKCLDVGMRPKEEGFPRISSLSASVPCVNMIEEGFVQ